MAESQENALHSRTHHQTVAAQRRGTAGSFLATYLPEFFHCHDNVAIVERHVSGGGKLESGSAGTDFLDREVDGSLANVEEQRQSDFAKSRVDFLDPLLEALRIKSPHVPGQDRVNELADRFALLFWTGMHQDHT